MSKMTYSQTLEYMMSKLPMYQRIGAAAYKKDLTNIQELCNFLGNPQSNFKSIHIAGTNGKGTTSHIISALFQTTGKKTGLYTSPHYKDLRERIRINGQMVSKKFVVDFIDRLKFEIDRIQPSFFEINVAMAFEWFSINQVDIAIIETGLGGRLDSTNIIIPEVSIITNISYDHMNLLGETLPAIAAEKAGIIKYSVPVIISETQETTSEVFQVFASQRKSEIRFADQEFEVIIKESGLEFSKFQVIESGKPWNEVIETPLHGAFQLKNIAGVIAFMKLYNELHPSTFDRSNLLLGLKEIKVLTDYQGRWQILNHKPLTICDSGHNEGGIRYIVNELSQIKHQRLHIVFGAVNDKDLNKIISLLPSNAKYYFAKAKIPRGLPAKELLELGRENGLKGKAYTSVAKAYSAARLSAQKEDLIFIGGSIFVVAEVL